MPIPQPRGPFSNCAKRFRDLGPGLPEHGSEESPVRVERPSLQTSPCPLVPNDFADYSPAQLRVTRMDHVTHEPHRRQVPGNALGHVYLDRRHSCPRFHCLYFVGKD